MGWERILQNPLILSFRDVPNIAVKEYSINLQIIKFWKKLKIPLHIVYNHAILSM